MKFTIPKQSLVDAVSHVNIAVSSRTTIPVLTGIKLEVDETGCTLTASDSDISIQVHIPPTSLDIAHGGKVVLTARLFVDIVRKLPAETVEVEVGEQYTTTIRSGQSQFQLNGMDPDEFPRLPQMQGERTFSVESSLLKTMIRQSSFSVSTVETRPVLTGVFWQLNDGVLRFTATDSHRLALREAQVEVAGEPQVNEAIVPGKSLVEMNKILKDDDRMVDVVLTDNQLLVKTENLLFYSRLLEGNYPDTSRIIPQSSKMTAILNREDLLGCIERASLLTKSGKNNVVKLTADDDLLQISANTPEIGKVSETVDVTELTGEALKISFNAKFVIDALRALDSEQVRVSFTGAMAPFVIQPTDQDAILYLILPVRTY